MEYKKIKKTTLRNFKKLKKFIKKLNNGRTKTNR